MWVVSWVYLQRKLMLAGPAQICAFLVLFRGILLIQSLQCACFVVHACHKALRLGAALLAALLIAFWSTKVHMLPLELAVLALTIYLYNAHHLVLVCILFLATT
jgi:hypothetical protein